MKRILNILLFLLAATFTLAAQPFESVTYKVFNQNYPPLECVGTVKVFPSGKIAAERWSVGYECVDRGYARYSESGAYISQLGVSRARIQSGWARTEQKKGKYDYAWLDEVVDGIVSQNVTPWMCLGYGNPIYSSEVTLGAKIFTDEPTMKAWEKYVETTVARYKGKVGLWEVWNEPNQKVNKDNPSTYTNLLVRTCEAIKRVDPEARIAAFALASVDARYLSHVLNDLRQMGKTDLFSHVSLHKYYENPDDCDYDFMALRKIIHDFNPEIIVFQGESGCPSKLEWTHALKHIQFDEYIQAKTVLRRMCCDFAIGQACSVFTLTDLVYPDMQQSFGLLRTGLDFKVKYKKPSFYAVRNLVNLLPDNIQPFEVEYTSNTAREMKVTGLKDGDKVVGVMYYFSDNAPVSSLDWDSVTMTLKNLKIKNPVFVEPITGKVFNLNLYHYSPNSPDTKYTNIPVWDSPVMIMDKESLNLLSPEAGRKELEKDFNTEM